MAEAVVESPGAGGPWARARARLRSRLGFRLAVAGLKLVVSLAVFAPFLASERPLWLDGVRRGEYERALRTLRPVAQALGGLLESDEAGYLSARPEGATQDLAAARAAEVSALRTRLDALRGSLSGESAERVDAFEAELDELLDETGAQAAPGAAAALVARVGTLREHLDTARVALRSRRTSPLVEGLHPVEAGVAVAWLLVLILPLRGGRARLRRALVAAAVLGVATAAAWEPLVGSGASFHTTDWKRQLSSGDIEVRNVVFAPVPYGFAEQHPAEALRPPTWLASAELDAGGGYLRGPRVRRPDPVTGFVPVTRPVDVRSGEPALNSPWRHLLGTDTTGRDLLARILHGGRVSLLVGLLATALLMGVGTAVGALAGWFGGVVDAVLSRVIEVVVAFPLFFIVLVAVAFVGPSLWNVIVVLGLAGWTGVARLCRTEVQRERELDYVAAARAMGFGWPRIVVRHVLPNALAPLFVAATFSVAAAILVEAGISFLGYGVRVPVPSWGALASESRDLANWWMQVFPGLFLFATVLVVQLIGDALRDALDPRHEVRR